MESSVVEQKLDSIITILKLAFKDQLAEVRDSVRGDPARAAILDATSETWVAGGSLVPAVAKKANKSERSIQNYLGELVDSGLVERRGAGRSTEYRSTGVI